MLDYINAAFELVGAVFVWSNVFRLRRDRCVQGVNLSVSGFYCVWGMSSLVYYADLGHWWSFAGNLAILSANAVWLTMALRLRQGAGDTIGHGRHSLPTPRNHVP